jgi:hypothetical protein
MLSQYVCKAWLQGQDYEAYGSSCKELRLTRKSPGQRPKDKTHLLQGQRLQKAYTAQSHPIQGRKGTSNSPLERFLSDENRRRSSRKESVVMIANNPVMVVKRSLSSTRRRKLRRRSC